MSIEFTCAPHPDLDDEQSRCLLDDLRGQPGYVVVRDTGTEIGLAFSGIEESSGEMVTVTVAETEIYVGFHAATRDQRESLLEVLRSRLTSYGITCHFEEQ